MNETTKFAVLTFYKKIGCPPCNALYNGPWQKISADNELKLAGVDFIVYEVGIEKDPKTGKLIRYDLPSVFKGKIRYFPYLDLKLPNNKSLGLEYGSGKSRDHSAVKQWILDNLKTPAFQEYKNSVNSGNVKRETRATVKELATNMNRQEPISVKQEIKNPEIIESQFVQNSNNNNVTAPKKTRKFIPINM